MTKNHNNTMSNEEVKNIIHMTRLPEPTTLEKYKNIIPDGADRIMSMFEKEQENRHKVENKPIDNKFFLAKRGQLLGFIIVLAILGCGTYLTIIGERIVGGALLGTTIVGLARIFVIGKSYPAKKSA